MFVALASRWIDNRERMPWEDDFDVEDVVHNVFLQIAGALCRFDPKRSLRVAAAP